MCVDLRLHSASSLVHPSIHPLGHEIGSLSASHLGRGATPSPTYGSAIDYTRLMCPPSPLCLLRSSSSSLPAPTIHIVNVRVCSSIDVVLCIGSADSHPSIGIQLDFYRTPEQSQCRSLNTDYTHPLLIRVTKDTLLNFLSNGLKNQ